MATQNLPDMNPTERGVFEALAKQHPQLAGCVAPLAEMHLAVAACLEKGGTLFCCGNGGSHSDALHFSGELLKEFHLKRALPANELAQYHALPWAGSLEGSLRPGLPVAVLGLNGALNSAFINDMPDARVLLAQELRALGHPGDMLLGISTSGNALNIMLAFAVAKARGIKTVALTGRDGGQLAKMADVALIAPGQDTAVIQENHIVLYHALAAALEERFYRQ